MKDLKKVKYLILDMDGCVYHPKFLKTLFGQVSDRMTKFIYLKLGLDKIKDWKKLHKMIYVVYFFILAHIYFIIKADYYYLILFSSIFLVIIIFKRYNIYKLNE